MKYALTLLADWANGIFALLLAAHLTDTGILWWYVPLALALSHAPDLDAIPELLRRGKVAASSEHPYDHREGLHYPLLVLPVLVALAYFAGFWGVLLLINFLLHYLNDFYGTGWGLKILWPLSKRNYKLLGRRANRLRSILEADGDWKRLSESERRLRLVVSWRQDELPGYTTRFGLEDWVNPYYLRLNWISTVEYTLFIVACVLLYLELS